VSLQQILTLALELTFAAAGAGWVALAASLLFRDRLRMTRPPTLCAQPLRVQVIIPCRAHPDLARNLEGFAGQTRVALQLTLVTASAGEEAAGVARALCARFPSVAHQVAGDAVGRGQKNHNLLAGLSQGSASAPEVVIFCDDDCYPDRDTWVAEFAAEALAHDARGGGALTTFRQVELESAGSIGGVLYFLGTAFQRASVSLTGRFVWGGALALTRRALQALPLEEVWSDTVVDDIALSRALNRRGMPIAYAPGCILHERCGPLPPRVASDWLFRQLQFLRYYMPSHFAQVLWLSLTTVLAGGVLAAGLALGTGPDLGALGCVAGYSVMVSASALLHAPSPRAGLWALCLALGPWSIWAGARSGLRCLLTDRVVWGTRTYAMARDGTVVTVSGAG
jgi:cellulose synthase/poly-beta-1,6-N-acetylglucosamine synthase-like glycosyltransferase